MTDFSISVAASRPAVREFFAELRRQNPGIRVGMLPLDSRAIATASDGLGAAAVAVVDASIDEAEALEVLEEMRAQRPTLPIGVLFCCPHAAKAHSLRALVAAGAGGFLDLRLSPEETLGALRSLAGGRGIFHLQLAEGSSTALSEALGGAAEIELTAADLALLELLKRGMTDYEIGRVLYLSPHTVKHRIEKLRRRAQARNRVQLAAWAAYQDGLHGESAPGLRRHCSG
jgi:DNA-binding NarL/FixJ family response regulator